jgi:hypothetical protein
MAFDPSIKLPDDQQQAASVFQQLVGEEGLGVVLILQDDTVQAFETLGGLASQPKFNTTAVWAATANAVAGAKSVVDPLPNGANVSYGATGHRVVSINKSKVVSAVLSLADSQEDFELLRAFYCAAGTTVCDF